MSAYEAMHVTGVIGMLFHALEGITDTVTQKLAGPVLKMDEVVKKVAGIGSPVGMRRWDGPRVANRNKAINWEIRSEKFELTQAIGLDELRRDKTGQLETFINSTFRDPVETHWMELITEKIAAGKTGGTCYDGGAYFATNHSEGSSGNQSNLHAIDIAAPAAPTPTEFTDTIWSVLSKAGELKNDAGRPVVVPTDVTIMVPPHMWKPATIALGVTDNNVVTTTGYSQSLNLSGFKFEIVRNPFFKYGSGEMFNTRFCMFLNNGRAFMRGSELPTDIEVGGIGPDSPHTFLTDEIMVGLKAIRAVQTFDWRSAHLIEYS